MITFCRSTRGHVIGGSTRREKARAGRILAGLGGSGGYSARNAASAACDRVTPRLAASVASLSAAARETVTLTTTRTRPVGLRPDPGRLPPRLVSLIQAPPR